MKKRVNRPVSRPASRSVSRPASRPARPAAPRRSATPSALNQRAARRTGLQNQTRSVERVRPAVRPVEAPRQVMPLRPAPAAQRSVPALMPRQLGRQGVVRPGAPPRRQIARPGSAPAAQGRQAARPQAPPTPASRSARAAGRQAGLGTAPAFPGSAFALNTAAAHPSLGPELSALQYALSNLQSMSSFDDLSADLQELDADLSHALDLLEAARERGYRYQKDLDELAVKTAGAWQQIHDATQADIQREANAFQAHLAPLSTQVPQLNARLNNPASASPYLRSTATTVNGLLNDLNGRRRNLQARYQEIRSNTYQLSTRLTGIHWVLAQLEESRFGLQSGENIVMAVKARWDKAGDDDPEGILFLTNKRLAFERKEKVATKKILFITTAEELVQEVQFAEPVSAIKENKAQSKGLFGHQDFLEISFGGALGSLSLHLDGQDSKEWSSLVDRVRSGKIEEDRAAEGGLSFADLTGEITQADIVAIQAEVNELQAALMLSEPRAELESLENDMRSLERDLAALRARGYAIEKNLEADITVLATQWERVKSNAEKTLAIQAGVLSGQSQTINELMGRLAGLSTNLTAARPVFMQLKSAIASAEAQAAAALETVYGQFEDYEFEVEGLAAHLDWVDWMLDALATASFQLLATESGVAATEAMYARPGMEPENGILFLTDQRLVWEDRVGDYEVKVNIPLPQVANVRVDVVDQDSEPDEFLDFSFTGGAPVHEARFDIAAPVGEAWLQMVGRARNGDYATDRAVPLDESEIERIKNAPTQCPNCGAQLTAPILRGQLDVTCEFCGVVTRI